MPQVVNQVCAVCRERISSILDGEFCGDCGSPVHHGCRRPVDGPTRSGSCATCSADVSDTEATRERLMKLERETQEQANEDRRQADADQRRKAGKRDMAFGAVLLIGGLAFTGFDFAMTASQGGGTFWVATGAMGVGAYRLIRGVIRAMTA